ncbi:uncharacterized protein [Diadema antillarum]|uniref:uncharacterized protein n=1 Tax=Diadema antillarum TaxID=105358 RepID=UPI003A86D91E
MPGTRGQKKSCSSVSPPGVDASEFCEQISEEVRKFFSSEQFKELFKVSLVEAVRNEMQKLQTQLEIAEGKVIELEAEVKSKASVITSLQKQHELDSADIAKLKRDMNDAEQYSRRNCVRLYGIPENPKEDTDQVMLDLASEKLNIKLQRHEIDRSHRVGAPRTTSSRPGARKQPPPRAIIVKFTTYRTRDTVIKSRRRLKGTHVGIEEDLTAENRLLLTKAKEEVERNDKLCAAWSSDGRVIVLVKATNGSTVRKRIWSVSELKKL